MRSSERCHKIRLVDLIIFLKRLSDVFDDEVQGLADDYGDLEVAQLAVESNHNLVRFYLPEKSR